MNTAVDWLIKQIIEGEEIDYTTYSVILKEHVNRLSIFEKAKEMEKQELSRAFEQGKQAQWESQNMKKGLQPHNISFEEYYSTRYN
jgi:hypothetical protein